MFWWFLFPASSGEILCVLPPVSCIPKTPTFAEQGTVLNELIVKFFYGDFTPQGFKRYSGLWTGPPYGKKDLVVWRKDDAKIPEVCNPRFCSCSLRFQKASKFILTWNFVAHQDIAVAVAKLKEQMANPMPLGTDTGTRAA